MNVATAVCVRVKLAHFAIKRDSTPCIVLIVRPSISGTISWSEGLSHVFSPCFLLIMAYLTPLFQPPRAAPLFQPNAPLGHQEAFQGPAPNHRAKDCALAN